MQYHGGSCPAHRGRCCQVLSRYCSAARRMCWRTVQRAQTPVPAYADTHLHQAPCTHPLIGTMHVPLTHSLCLCYTRLPTHVHSSALHLTHSFGINLCFAFAIRAAACVARYASVPPHLRMQRSSRMRANRSHVERAARRIRGVPRRCATSTRRQSVGSTHASATAPARSQRAGADPSAQIGARIAYIRLSSIRACHV